MSPAIKNIGSISKLLADSNLSQSPIWNAPVERVVPAQLHSFLTRLAMCGKGNEARAELTVLLAELAAATARGQAEALHLIGYTESRQLTADELVRGLSDLKYPRPAAILFALDAETDIATVVSLRWSKAVRVRDSLPELASAILRMQPRHLHCEYVFWQGEQPLPLFGLEQDVFDAFGMVWAELANSYKRLIPWVA